MAEEKRDVQLNPAGAQLADHARNIWAVTATYGMTREDIENPGFWAHHAVRMRTKDKIEVHAEDGSFYAEYIVVNADRTWAKIVNTVYLNLAEAAVISGEQAKGISEGYEIKFRGPRKWSVIRKADHSILQEGMHSDADAKQWLAVHLNAQGIAA